jgi:hypothetical protein
MQTDYEISRFRSHVRTPDKRPAVAARQTSETSETGETSETCETCETSETCETGLSDEKFSRSASSRPVHEAQPC